MQLPKDLDLDGNQALMRVNKRFLEIPVGTKFTLNNSATLLKITAKSYCIYELGITPKKCKGSGRYYMPKTNPNPIVTIV